MVGSCKPVMETLAEPSKSFKIDRKSSLSSKLKTSISQKLRQFLGDYTDDVLAEYITVLVCNGKSQIQAKHDLEAFLGDSSGEFVSWLWGYLFRHVHMCRDVVATSPRSCSVERDFRSYRSEDGHSCSDACTGSPLTKNRNFHTTAHVPGCVSRNNAELSENTQYCKVPVSPSIRLGSNKEGLQKHRIDILKEVGTGEKVNGDTLRAPAITIGRTQSFGRAEKSKLIVDQKENELAGLVSNFSRMETDSRSLDLPTYEREAKEGLHGRKAYAANLSARDPLSTGVTMNCQSKSRGSVWDRLGGPCEENFVASDKSLDAHVGDIVEKHSEAEELPKLPFLTHGAKPCPSMKYGIHDLAKNSEPTDSNDRSQGQSARMICKPFVKNKIQLKRTYSDVSSNSPHLSMSSVYQNCVDNHFKESSNDSEKLISSAKSATPVLLSQVRNVRQKLQEVEMEMSKLRTKQLEVNIEGQLPVLSGAPKHSDEDADSRTVFVSNVHFAVTKEVLSSHFAKFGVVSDVLMLTDKLKGSAYVTFASKDSLEKAVALNGTFFFSRALKVVKKGEEAVALSRPPMSTVKPLILPQLALVKRKPRPEKRLNPPRTHHRLQWRREPCSAPPEPSPASTAEARVS